MNKWNIKQEQADVLKELEELIGKPFPILDYSDELWRGIYQKVGVEVESKEVFGLCLIGCRLESLPTSIKKLRSLRKLDLNYNEIMIFPKLILELKKLELLNLTSNKITLTILLTIVPFIIPA